ncbi:MAG: hypothetical protein BWY63_03519 [Chloroflexi bacterium ADurb.Bin360]|nr:MAG: hypothetical protein BWY63_03519 [Chloroflexi bacterium ADurb.Bin360]
MCFTTDTDARVHPCVSDVQDKDRNRKEIGKGNYQRENQGNIIAIERHGEKPAHPFYIEEMLENNHLLPQAGEEQGEIGEHARQCRAQDVAAFEESRGNTLGFGKVYVILVVMQEEKCAPGKHALEEFAHEDR